MRYLASLFFKSTLHRSDGSEAKESFWEEIIVFLLATSEKEALQEANEIGKRKSGVSYPSESGQVTWEFVTVERVVPFENNELRHADELFSRYLRASEATSILGKFD